MITIVKKPFEEVLSEVKRSILDAGFLILHEINTKEILGKHGYHISELRQLLFFRPEYMNTILKTDVSCVIKVPLKIVVRQLENGGVELTYTPASELFESSPGLKSLANELDKKIINITMVN